MGGQGVEDPLDDMTEGGHVSQLDLVIEGDVIGLSHGGEGLRLLYGVDAEVGLHVEVQLEHLDGVSGLLGHQLQNAVHHQLTRVGGWRMGDLGGRGGLGEDCWFQRNGCSLHHFNRKLPVGGRRHSLAGQGIGFEA